MNAILIFTFNEKQGIINPGDSNSENSQVKTKPDGYIYQITEELDGDWKVLCTERDGFIKVRNYSK